MPWKWIVKLGAWLFRQERAMDAVDGFERLNNSMLHWQLTVEKRLDECDDDRATLKSKCDTLQTEVDECKQDRDELRARVTKLETKVQ